MPIFNNQPAFESPLKDSDQIIVQGVPSPLAESKAPSTMPPKLSPEEIIRLAETGQLEGKLSAILDRARTTQRMHVPLPDDMHGEWVRDDPMEIASMQALGFDIDTKYARNRGFNATGEDGPARVADVIYMTAPKIVKVALDNLRYKEMRHKHDKRQGGYNKEEEDFMNLTRADTDGVIPTTVESYSTPATINSIQDAIRSSQSQTP